jgi:plasmid stabilization system protein ParE
MARVTFTLEARVEARDARLWLKDRQPQTVEGFRARLRDARTLLEQFPEAGRPDVHGTRRLDLSPYPYSLIYRVRADRVSIIAVPHDRQQRYWSSR